MSQETQPRIIRPERTAAAARLIRFLVEYDFSEEDIRRLVRSADEAEVLGSPDIADCADALKAFLQEQVQS